MPVPDFQTLMRPVLVVLANDEDRASSEIRAAIADQFSLTEHDLAERR